MTKMPHLSSLECEIMLKIPSLFPDGDSDDLKIKKATRDEISDAIGHLEGLGYVWASHHDRLTNLQLTTAMCVLARKANSCGEFSTAVGLCGG